MAKFKITWGDGTVEEVNQQDCLTVSQYINCRFGSANIGGTVVELADLVDAEVVSTKTRKEKAAESASFVLVEAPADVPTDVSAA